MHSDGHRVGTNMPTNSPSRQQSELLPAAARLGASARQTLSMGMFTTRYSTPIGAVLHHILAIAHMIEKSRPPNRNNTEVPLPQPALHSPAAYAELNLLVCRIGTHNMIKAMWSTQQSIRYHKFLVAPQHTSQGQQAEWACRTKADPCSSHAGGDSLPKKPLRQRVDRRGITACTQELQPQAQHGHASKGTT